MSRSLRSMTIFALAIGAAALAGPALAASLHAQMALATASGPGGDVGFIDVADGPGGATFSLHLHGLPPGPHGFHLHENSSCAAALSKEGAMTPAGAAGGHLDPAATGMHMGPNGAGHLGDLPLIVVSTDGTVSGTVTGPRLKDVSTLKGRTLMIHAGGDTYSDTPPRGGGGARIACGVLD